jgi:hypothetical protein
MSESSATPPTTYFHLGLSMLAPGSIIEPGNMGRLHRRYTRPAPNQAGWGDPWHLARELIFEEVRNSRTQFSALPSRLGAAFVCPTRADIDAFRRMVDPFLTHMVCEIEIVDPTLPQHTSGINWLDLIPPGQPFLDTTRMNAIQYWSGAPNGPTEILTASSLRVLSCTP